MKVGFTMKVKSYRAILIGAAMTSALIVGAGGSAFAADVEAPAAVDLSGKYISPDVDPSQPAFLVDEEGTETPVTLGEGVANADRSAARAGCAWYNMAIPVGGAWYTSVDGCSLIGANDSATHIYEFAVDPNSNGTACITGRGYKKVGTSWSPVWQGVGCGTSGASTVTIGNVYTVGKIQGQSIGTTGTALKWK